MLNCKANKIVIYSFVLYKSKNSQPKNRKNRGCEKLLSGPTKSQLVLLFFRRILSTYFTRIKDLHYRSEKRELGYIKYRIHLYKTSSLHQ